MSVVKPITPDQVIARKLFQMPDMVIEVFNNMIAENWNGQSATVLQTAAAVRIAEALEITTEQVYVRHYLEVEGIYREAGWVVKYDHRGYNEDGPNSFTFSKKV